MPNIISLAFAAYPGSALEIPMLASVDGDEADQATRAGSENDVTIATPFLEVHATYTG